MYAVPNTAPLNTLITSLVVLVISRSHSPHKVAIGFAIGLAIQPILDMLEHISATKAYLALADTQNMRLL